MIDEHKIYIRGNTALVTGRITSGDCESVSRQYRFTNRYVKRDEKWEIISSQLTTVSPVQVVCNLPCG